MLLRILAFHSFLLLSSIPLIGHLAEFFVLFCLLSPVNGNSGCFQPLANLNKIVTNTAM